MIQSMNIKFILLSSFVSSLIIAISTSLFAQAVNNDSTVLSQSIASAREDYFTTIRSQAEVYNGSEYVDFERRIVGHQFFETDLHEEGSIVYEGIEYQNLEMQYEIYRDLCLIKHFSEKGFAYSIELNSQKIQEFRLLDHRFVFLSEDSVEKFNMKAGFYDIVMDREVKYFVKRIKTINQQSSADLTEEFLQKDKYFILKDQQYHQVRSRRSVLKLFPAYKKPLKKYFRRNRIYFNDDREFAIGEAIRVYLQMKN